MNKSILMPNMEVKLRNGKTLTVKVTKEDGAFLFDESRNKSISLKDVYDYDLLVKENEYGYNNRFDVMEVKNIFITHEENLELIEEQLFRRIEK